MKSSTFSFWLSIGLLATLLWACKGKNTTKPDNNKSASGQMLSTADSTLLHFWDQFDMNDTAQVKNPDKGEQRLADFIGLLSRTPDSAMRDRAVDSMLNKAKSNRASFDHFVKLYEHYLYDGNSPMRNDVVYESGYCGQHRAQCGAQRLLGLPDAGAAQLCNEMLFGA